MGGYFGKKAIIHFYENQENVARSVENVIFLKRTCELKELANFDLLYN